MVVLVESQLPDSLAESNEASFVPNLTFHKFRFRSSWCYLPPHPPRSSLSCSFACSSLLPHCSGFHFLIFSLNLFHFFAFPLNFDSERLLHFRSRVDRTKTYYCIHGRNKPFDTIAWGTFQQTWDRALAAFKFGNLTLSKRHSCVLRSFLEFFLHRRNCVTSSNLCTVCDIKCLTLCMTYPCPLARQENECEN